MHSLGFEGYHDTLNLFLTKYREVSLANKNVKTTQVTTTKTPSNHPTPTVPQIPSNMSSVQLQQMASLLAHHHSLSRLQDDNAKADEPGDYQENY